MNVFPEIVLSDTEMDIVMNAFSQPVIQKYLNMLAYNVGRDIVMGSKAPGQSPDDYLLMEANSKGQLAALDTLLSIKNI